MEGADRWPPWLTRSYHPRSDGSSFSRNNFENLMDGNMLHKGKDSAQDGPVVDAAYQDVRWDIQRLRTQVGAALS